MQYLTQILYNKEINSIITKNNMNNIIQIKNHDIEYKINKLYN